LALGSLGTVYVDTALQLPCTEQILVGVLRVVHGEGEGVEVSFQEHADRVALVVLAVTDMEPAVIR
jgi:hypothetical protein